MWWLHSVLLLARLRWPFLRDRGMDWMIEQNEDINSLNYKGPDTFRISQPGYSIGGMSLREHPNAKPEGAMIPTGISGAILYLLG